MIGKMFRPVEIKTMEEPRGFRLKHKMKSNYGGQHNFLQNIYLRYDFEAGQQELVLDFSEEERSILLKSEKYKPLTDKKAQSRSGSKNFKTFRLIKRPGSPQTESSFISSKDGILTISFTIESEDNPKENDVLLLKMKPTVYKNKEYLFVEAEAKTKVIIQSNLPIHYGDYTLK